MSIRLSTVISFLSLSLLSSPVVAEDVQSIYLAQLKGLCGKAFMGRVVMDTADSATYRNKDVILHVRDCSDKQIKMPMHVGDNSSRILVLTVVDGGLQLEHDHRHHDGTSDDLTLYGGTTTTKGTFSQQNFPVNDVTAKMFVDADIERSLPNVWSIKVFPGKTAMYQLKRPTLTFQIEFDLTKEVKNPPKAWDLVKH